MAKDPATLWYWNDFLTGTMTFSRHLKGCYMDLLGAQFNNGRLSLDEIKTVLGNDFASWGALSKKFMKDDNGLYYNIKAEETKNKRANYTKSRRDNLMGDHMENEIENRKIKFKLKIEEKLHLENKNLVSNFYDYWTEHSDKGNKMRFEKETVFDIIKRFATWKRNNKNYFTKEITHATNNPKTGDRISKSESIKELADLSRQVLNSDDGPNG